MQNKAWFREIPADQVNPQVCLAAYTMLEYVKKDLDLPKIEIRWVLEDDPTFAKIERLLADLAKTEPETFETDPFSGLTKSFHDGIIWVRADLSPQDVALTVAHEARHLWQLQHYRPPITPEEKEAAERDAMEYEKGLSAKFKR